MLKNNPYILRCYARPEGDHLIGVCVDLDITVRGVSIDEVRKQLTLAIQSYLESLDKDNIKDVFPRPSPFNVMLDYYFVYSLVNCIKVSKRIRAEFDAFCELATPQGFKVTLCA